MQKQRKRRAVLTEKYQHYSGEYVLRWAYPPNVFNYLQHWHYELVSTDKAREFEVGQEYTITIPVLPG